MAPRVPLPGSRDGPSRPLLRFLALLVGWAYAPHPVGVPSLARARVLLRLTKVSVAWEIALPLRPSDRLRSFAATPLFIFKERLCNAPREECDEGAEAESADQGAEADNAA